MWALVEHTKYIKRRRSCAAGMTPVAGADSSRRHGFKPSVILLIGGMSSGRRGGLESLVGTLAVAVRYDRWTLAGLDCRRRYAL